MKKLIMIFIIISFISCDEDELQQKEIFNTSELSKLSLNDIDNFWNNDNIKRVLDFTEDAIFNTHPAYLGGIRYEGEKNVISVTVFNSQITSIEAMELRRNNAATIIKDGAKHDSISGKWWFGDTPPYTIFLNKINTIIEVTYNYYPTYAENETVLIQIAIEIAQRIDSLSN
jgi:hypothetical protein